MVEISEWTPEFLEELAKRQVAFDVAREGRFREYQVSGREFPEV
jgi:hypothetical protein